MSLGNHYESIRKDLLKTLIILDKIPKLQHLLFDLDQYDLIS